MEKIFWKNAYKDKLKAKIQSVDNNKILLEKTIIFSFSGGQESDKAWINGLEVLNSEIEGSLIYYTVAEGSVFYPGQEVSIKIDWPRRYRLMRLHFAAELVLELVTRMLGIEKIGAHISENKARIDFIFDKNISSIFEDILKQYNEIVRSNKVIKTGFSDMESQRRFWEIDGFSKVSCGGTHVKSTAEVGFIALKRKNIGGSKERIEITLIEDTIHLPEENVL